MNEASPAAEPNKVDLRQWEPIATILLNAICENIPTDDPRFEKIKKLQAENGGVEVMAAITGTDFTIPIVPALRTIIERVFKDNDRLASDKAYDYVLNSGLMRLVDALHGAETDIKDALRAAGAKDNS